MAIYIPLGIISGWFVYKGIPALYLGALAFVSLYNDPRAPLLWLLPSLFAMLTSIAVWHYGVKAYRRHKSVRAKSPNSAPSWNLWMAIALWAIAFAILVLAFYLRFRLVPR
ncbi:membrane protein of unknown function [Aminobacter niigataensis]|nr:membrane protein of unknown function [Aminobacter niigataensis]